jgi:hypothetical protein
LCSHRRKKQFSLVRLEAAANCPKLPPGLSAASISSSLARVLHCLRGREAALCGPRIIGSHSLAKGFCCARALTLKFDGAEPFFAVKAAERDVLVFGIVFLLLAVRPNGLFPSRHLIERI